MATGKRTGDETGNDRTLLNWQVRRGLTAVGMAVVLVAAMALLIAVGPNPAQACIFPGIPC